MAGHRKLTIGILAHVDAGKTTLSEALLYETGELRKLGRVDHKDAFLDDTAVERNRGITVFSKHARFTLHSGIETDVVLIDTPGHVDFSAEMERTLAVLDYALLVISGSEGVQAHTKTLYRMLRERGIPIFIFVNKMDIAIRKPSEIIDELCSEIAGSSNAGGTTSRIGAVDFTNICTSSTSSISSISSILNEDFIDDVTLASPALADIVLEEGRELSDLDIALSIARGELIPCVFGSALRLEGIAELLEVLARFTIEPPRRDGLAGIVYKIGSTETGERLAYVKLTGGRLHARDRITGHTQHAEDWEAKVNQIRLYSGSRYVTTDEACAGEVCALTGLAEARVGDTLGDEPLQSEGEHYSIAPYISSIVQPPADKDPYLVMKDFAKLAEEDPALNVRWHADTRQIEIRLMGEVQLEVITGICKDKFGYEVSFDAGRILYLETISETSDAYEGVGHFEPLRHYAEVHLILEPAERGSGITITSDTPEDELARNWQRLILTNIAEKEHLGVLIGAPLTDVKITLAAGRAHDKHTSGGDFREATYRAVRNALMQARRDGKAVLLEPWQDYEISLPSANVGRAMTDIKQMGGTQASLEQLGDVSRIRGQVPASEIAGYELVLLGYTGGMGRLSCSQAGYMPCHNAEAVVAELGYDPERDVENSADSVMVSHSGSDIVRWDKIFDVMHLPSVLATRRRLSTGTGGGGSGGGASPNRNPSGGNTSGTGRDPKIEKELQRIFESTYGARKEHSRREARTTKYSGENSGSSGGNPGEKTGNSGGSGEKSGNSERNLEIRAKHERKSLTATAAGEGENSPVILIDGYNLVYADEYLKELTKIDSGAARDQLIERVGNYAAYLGYEVTLVFDAYRVPYGAGSEEEIHGIRVIYTREDEPADIRIGSIIN